MGIPNYSVGRGTRQQPTAACATSAKARESNAWIGCGTPRVFDQEPTAGREDLAANVNAHRSPEWRSQQEVAHMPYGVGFSAKTFVSSIASEMSD